MHVTTHLHYLLCILEEYLKHICHPMCKKTCVSSCAPGCCAGEQHHDFPLYHRKSTHCHPLCKKHCISACPLTCCADTHMTLRRKWRHPHVQHFKPGCHPMCKRNCVPSCPKACCTLKPAKPKSHCHPLCKTHCLSSCPLSCCSKSDRKKEMCHPLCRKTCLPSCPKECCKRKNKGKELIMENNPEPESHASQRTTCPGKCPDVSTYMKYKNIRINLKQLNVLILSGWATSKYFQNVSCHKPLLAKKLGVLQNKSISLEFSKYLIEKRTY